MLSSYVKIGDRAEITSKTDESIKKSYASLVENKVSETEFDLDVPISYGRLVALNLGAGYQIMFSTDSGFYIFDAIIEKYFKEDGFNLMRVRLTSKGEKKQRREFFRYECQLPLKYAIAEADGDKVRNKTLYEGIIIDLSGGGIRYAASERLDEGRVVKCAFMLEKDLIAVNAKVLYKDEINLHGHKFQYRAQFIKIPLSDQERIVQYIFLQQRKMLGRVY